MIRQLNLIVFLIFINANLLAQDECDAYLTSSTSKNKKLKKTSYPLNFATTNSEINAFIQFNNQAKEKTIEMSLAFADKSGFEVNLGDILTIQFEDGSEFSFLATKKRSRASISYFVLLKPDRTDKLSYLSYGDILLCKKLHEVNIKSLGFIANYKKMEILIPETRAEIIKIIINCFDDCL